MDEHGAYRGELRSTGLRPQFLDRLADRGVHVSPAALGLQENLR